MNERVFDVGSLNDVNKVEKFLQEKQAEEQKKLKDEMNKTLLELGLYEKEFSSNDAYSNEYPYGEWDSESNTIKYYKKNPCKVTAEEYDEIKKYSQKKYIDVKNGNPIATALSIIAWIIYIAGFIVGIALGNTEVVRGTYYVYTVTEFSFALAFTYWSIAFISGTTFLGFAEIIKLLNDIKNK